MLKLAIEAQLPLVAVNTRDTLNLAEVVREVSKKQLVQFAINGPFGKNAVYGYVHQPDTKFVLPLAQLYEKMTQVESTLLIVNPPAVIEPMYDAGEVPVPRPLMLKFLKMVVADDKKAEELLRGLGGCTIKEAAELCRLTMAREFEPDRPGSDGDAEIQFPGLEGPDPGRRQAEFLQPARIPQEWVKREKAFFLTGDDPRLRPRGLLFDGRARHRQDLRRRSGSPSSSACRSTGSTSAGPRGSISARASRTRWRTSPGSTRPSPASA